MSTGERDQVRQIGDAELTERLIEAAQDSDRKLSQAEIDLILGVEALPGPG
ncbi:MAG TPA: hypothetical protein VLB29_02625 [Nocardioidaceae bacterium]|nr:hypothetical protein [Nocardioidaceae bacterium]